MPLYLGVVSQSDVSVLETETIKRDALQRPAHFKFRRESLAPDANWHPQLVNAQVGEHTVVLIIRPVED